MKEYFEILGIPINSPFEAIKKAWKKKCFDHHPDKGGDKSEFIKVTHAYKMLTDSSYICENMKEPINRLEFRVQAAVTFEEAFFGTKLVISYNQLELDSEYNVLKEQDYTPYSFIVDIPPGCTGLEYRKSQGGMKRLGIVGDAIVTVFVSAHPKFKLQGNDVLSKEAVPLNTMLKGGNVEILTLYGIKTVKVPPGTAPGEQLFVPNCGVSKRGSHIIIVEPRYPSKDELRSDSWKGLNIDWGSSITLDNTVIEDIEFEAEMRRLFNEANK